MHENQLPSKKPGNILSKLRGITGPHIPPLEILSRRADQTGLPLVAIAFKNLERRIPKALNLNLTRNILSVATLGLLLTGHHTEAIGCSILVAATQAARGHVSTLNEKTYRKNLLALENILSAIEMGEEGRKLKGLFLESLTNSSILRNIGNRPAELILWMLAETTIVALNTPSAEIGTLITLISMSLIFAQYLLSKNKFVPANKKAVEAGLTFIATPNDMISLQISEKNDNQAAKQTILINLISSVSNSLLRLYAALATGPAGIISAVITSYQSNYSSIAQSLEIFETASKANIDLKSALNSSGINEHFGKLLLSNEAKLAHIEKEPALKLDEEIINRLIKPFTDDLHNIAQFLLVDLKLTNVGEEQTEKIASFILPFYKNKLILFLGKVGTGKTHLMDALCHIDNQHNGHSGKIKIKDGRWIFEDDHNDMIGRNNGIAIWDKNNFLKTDGNFEKNAGFRSRGELSKFISSNKIFASIIKEQKIEDKIYNMDLGDKRLSEGQRKTLMIVAHIISSYKNGKTTFLIDEPFYGLDDPTTQLLCQFMINFKYENQEVEFFLQEQKPDIIVNKNTSDYFTPIFFDSRVITSDGYYNNFFGTYINEYPIRNYILLKKQLQPIRNMKEIESSGKNNKFMDQLNSNNEIENILGRNYLNYLLWNVEYPFENYKINFNKLKSSAKIQLLITLRDFCCDIGVSLQELISNFQARNMGIYFFYNNKNFLEMTNKTISDHIDYIEAEANTNSRNGDFFSASGGHNGLW